MTAVKDDLADPDETGFESLELFRLHRFQPIHLHRFAALMMLHVDIDRMLIIRILRKMHGESHDGLLVPSDNEIDQVSRIGFFQRITLVRSAGMIDEAEGKALMKLNDLRTILAHVKPGKNPYAQPAIVSKSAFYQIYEPAYAALETLAAPIRRIIFGDKEEGPAMSTDQETAAVPSEESN
jgi:hypothetical protein